MASILEMNLDWARENNLPIAATYEKLLATPGGATLYDNEYNINNWEDLAEGLAEQLVSQLETKGTKDFLIDNARQISAVGAQTNSQDFNNFIQTLNTLPLTQTEANQANTNVQQGVADLNFTIANATELRQPGGGWGSLLGDVGRVTQQLAANPVVQVGIAYYMPGVVESFAPSLTAIGISNPAVQTAVANAITSTAVQVASGVPIENALQNSVVNAVVSTGSPEVAKAINTVVESPGVTNAIVSAGSSAAKTALNGGSEADITRNVIAGLVGSGTATATGSNIAGAAAGGAVTGGVTGALQNAASAYATQAGAEERAKTDAKSTETKVNNIIADELSQVGIAGALPASETGVYSRALENANEKLIRLVKEAANDADYLKKLPALEDALAKSGTSISKVLGTGISLGTYTSELNSNESAELQRRLNSAKVANTFSTLTPTDVNAPSGVVNVDLTKPETVLSNTDNIDPRLLDIVSAPVTNVGTSNTPYTPTIITPTITPSTTPSTTPNTSPSTSTSTSTNPINKPRVDTAVTPRTVTPLNPTVTPPSVTSPFSPIVLPFDGATSTTNTTVTSPRITTPSDTTTTPIDTTTTDTAKTDTTKKDVPVEDKTGKPVDKPYTPKIFTYGGVDSTLGTTLKTKTPFYPTSGTTSGLTSSRGAGEIESAATGKKRKNVWNEASLRLKDALGV